MVPVPIGSKQCSGSAGLPIDAPAAFAFHIGRPHLERLFISIQSLLLLDQVLLALPIVQAGICVGIVVQVNLHLHMEYIQNSMCKQTGM